MEQDAAQSWNILYIDDDEEDLIITRAMLAQMQGRRVRLEWAATFDAACEKLSRSSVPGAEHAAYDAVLVDYDLGRHTGIQIIAAYAPTYPAPLILFTGRGSAEVDREALQAGATMYLTKSEANPLLLERIIRYAIERKQTDRALYESQDRFRRMIEVSPDAIFVQTGGTFAYLNPAALRFFGAERLEQMRALPVIDFMDARDVEAVKARMEPLDRQRDPGPPREEGFLRLDGSRVDTETLTTPITYDGQPGALVIMRDITERARRQKNLAFLAEISDALACLSTPREMLETAGGKIFEFFGSSRVTFCEVDLADNCAHILYEQTGAGIPHSPAQISVSDFVDDVFLRDVRKGQVVVVNDHTTDPRTLHLAERYRAYGVSAQLLALIWNTESQSFILSVQKNTPYAWQQDEIELASGLVARIHPALEKALAQEALREGNLALKRAQIELANERNRLLAVLEALPVGVAIVGVDGSQLLANNAFEEIWGSPRPSVRGFEDMHAYTAWWAETGQPVLPDEWASSQVVLRGEPVLGQYLKLQRFDGSMIYVLNSAAPVRDLSGRVLASAVTIQDITGRVMAQQARDASEKLRMAAVDELQNSLALLAQSEEKFSKVFQKAPYVASITTPKEARIVDVNEAWVQTFGYAREEAIGKTVIDLGIQAEETVRKRLLAQLQQNPLRAVEVILPTRRGEKRTILFNLDLIEIGGEQFVLNAGQDITVQKRAEEERLRLMADLDRQKALLETLVNSISQMVWMTDEQGSIVWMNRRGVEFTGLAAGQMHAFNWDEAQHPDFRAQVTESYLHSIATGSAWEAVSPLRGKDGLFRWFLTRATPVHDESGRATSWLATSTDITELRELQEENREQKELLERLVNAAPAGIAFLNGPHHVYTLVNPEYERISRGKGRMIGRTVAEMWPEIMEEVKPQMDAVYREGTPFSVVDAPLTIIRDGVPEQDYFTYTFTPITAAGGQAEGIMILAIETTQEVRSRQAIEAHSARLSAVLESLPIGVWIADADGRLIQKNRQVDRIWGGDAPLAKDIDAYQQYEAWDAASGERLAAEDYPLARALREGQRMDWRELHMRRFDGSEGDVLVFVELIRDSEDHVLGAVAINMDITERKQTEQQLKHYAEELERSNQALQDFASIAGHDLQEPLRKITLFGQMLDEQYSARLEGDGSDYIARMTSAANRMSAMLASLLAYSRVNTQGEPFQDVDLNRVAAEVQDDLEARILETAGRVEIGPLPAVHADPVQMRQVLQNLLGNALKFHRPGVPPEVSIRGRALENGRVEILISDNGIGFENHRAALVFQPFRRMHGRSDYAGSGMGLAICKKIVERHGGEISAESIPGQGSTFRVVLPAASRA